MGTKSFAIARTSAVNAPAPKAETLRSSEPFRRHMTSAAGGNTPRNDRLKAAALATRLPGSPNWKSTAKKTNAAPYAAKVSPILIKFAMPLP